MPSTSPDVRFQVKSCHPLPSAGCLSCAITGHQKRFTLEFFTNFNQMHTKEREAWPSQPSRSSSLTSSTPRPCYYVMCSCRDHSTGRGRLPGLLASAGRHWMVTRSPSGATKQGEMVTMTGTLYARLGGYDAIAAVTENLLGAIGQGPPTRSVLE